jgi:hypothetical protein
MLEYYKFKKYLDKSSAENKKHAKFLKCLDGENCCDNLRKNGCGKYFCTKIKSLYHSIMETQSCPAENRTYAKRWF